MENNDLTALFKSTAVTLTKLYRESISSSNQQYQAGYQQCMQEFFSFVQSHSHESSQFGSSIPSQLIYDFLNQKRSSFNGTSPTHSSLPSLNDANDGSGAVASGPVPLNHQKRFACDEVLDGVSEDSERRSRSRK